MFTLLGYLLRVRIWYHWRQIIRYKKAGLTLLDRGEPFSSERLIELSRRIDCHGMIAFQLEKKLSEICDSETSCIKD